MVWDSYTDALLTDFVFDSNISSREIAVELGITETEVNKRIRDLGYAWVRRNNGHLSRGQAALTAIMRKLLPGASVVTEEALGERLRLDVYCPSYKLAAEYHGRQHFFYTEHFHGDKQGFYDSKRRDERKEELCKNLGIALVVFRYNDYLTEDAVFERLLDTLRNSPILKDEDEISHWKSNPYYESYKNRQREYRRMTYQKMKEKRVRR